MLLGRATEQERIRRLLAEVREGRSGALVLRGEPGVGKSALLEHARELAEGMTVLSARGLESEAELPFAGLSELIAPVLSLLDALPAPQRAALEGGLAMGPAGPPDRFAAYAGVLSLLAAAAEETPLLALVDDAHWLDSASSEALVFTARRLGEEGVAIVFAAREGERRTFTAPGLPEVRLAGLDAEATLALLAEGGEGEVSPALAERLCASTAGNPLALIELRELLTADQLEGREPLPDPLPLGASLEEAYRRRIEHLPPSAQRALTVAAAGGTGAVEEVRAALEALEIGTSALEPAEAVGIVSLSPERIEFRHPLLRSAAYHAGADRERRAAHEALADALPDERSLARRAWHRATAAVAPDEEVASELEQAAQEAMGRAAPAAAASAMEVAARLSPDPQEHVRRLQEAGRDAYLSGRFAVAARLLDEALAGTDDPMHRAEIRHLRGQVELFAGSPRAAREHMLAAARALEAVDAGRAAVALSDVAMTLAMEARATRALEIAERAHALAERLGGLPVQASATMLGGLAALCGDSELAAELAKQARPLLEGEAIAAQPWLAAGFAQTRTYLDEDREAQQIIRRTVETLRGASALGFLPYALAAQCFIEFRLGTWAEAYAAGSESVRLAEETGQRNELLHGQSELARVLAGYGRRGECRSYAEAVLAGVQATGSGAAGVPAKVALGLLELGSDRPEEAAEHFDDAECFHEGVRQPTLMRSAADRVEAHLRAGNHLEAERVLATLEEQAEQTDGRWAKAAAARCRGLLAAESEFEDYFLASLARHEQVPAPFETARTQLCFGERLRRARRPAEAREHLKRALKTLRRLGATPWAAKAERELDATGERRERRPADVRELLTPQELQVALRVSQGGTTKEAAAALFISPRTVDAHLSRIYRKLGIRSRAELTRVVVEGGLSGAESSVAGG